MTKLKQPVDGIIFDVDGTLWDSTEIVAGAWTDSLRGNDVNLTVTAPMLRGLFGQLLIDIARQLLPDEPPERQEALIFACEDEEHRVLEKTGAPLYPALEETLIELSRHYPLFIVSNCQAGYIELFLRKTGFGPYFQDHLCPGDTGVAKAENIASIVKRNRLSSPIYVGDTKGDYEASKKAGVPFVFASYGFGDVEEAEVAISCPKDLLKLLG